MEDILYKNSPSDIRIREMVSNISGGNDLSVNNLRKIKIHYITPPNDSSYSEDIGLPTEEIVEITLFPTIDNLELGYGKRTVVDFIFDNEIITILGNDTLCVETKDGYLYYIVRTEDVNVASRIWDYYLNIYSYNSDESVNPNNITDGMQLLYKKYIWREELHV